MPENYNTPYDDVFRTIIRDCRQLVIPLINEAFGKNYTGYEEIILKENEIYIRKQNGEEEKEITDSLISVIERLKAENYHIECQSTPDGSMIIRIYNYDSQIALNESVLQNGVLEVRFPHSAILYLRSGKSTPDMLTIRITTSNGSISHDVPVIKIKDYSIGEIFEKKLLFLIPFYIFTYEKDFNDIENDADKLMKLKETYADIKNTLENMCASGELDEYTKCTLCEMSEKVINSLAAKHENIKKEVTEVMGGKVLDYEAKDILNRGIGIGRSEGIGIGRSEGIGIGRSEGIGIGRSEGIGIGRSEGIGVGENKLAKLINKLIADNRQEDIEKVASDENIRKEMYRKYGIVD